MLHLHRTLNFVIGGVVALLIGVIVVMSFQSPLVVLMSAHEKRYYQTERKPDSITEKDVENFVRDFLEQLFTWEQLRPDLIMRQVSPFVTSGLLDRIRQELVQKTEKDFKGKTLSQGIVGVKVQVTSKEVIASSSQRMRCERDSLR